MEIIEKKEEDDIKIPYPKEREAPKFKYYKNLNRFLKEIETLIYNHESSFQ